MYCIISDIIGEFNITTRQLLSSQPEGINFELINRAKCKRKKFYNNSGIVNVRLNISTSTCSFLDYILSDPNNPSCKGVAGVLAAYNRVASDVRGTAPPNFSPLIKLVNDMARGSHGSSKYFVLLILTTGLVDDWVETRRAVIEVSTASFMT
nr:unnamed protein product [Spirometra erinaceieuropaei]